MTISRTLKDDFLTNGARRKFYQVKPDHQLPRAYEVLDLIPACETSFSKSLQLRVNLYVSGAREPNKSNLPLESHLEDRRITRGESYKLLRGLDGKIGGKWYGEKVLFRDKLEGPNYVFGGNEVYDRFLFEALETTKEFIKNNYRLFGIPKKPKLPTIVFYHQSLALPRSWTILLDRGKSDTFIDNCHEAAHLLHYSVNPQIWAVKHGLYVTTPEEAVRELVAELATINHCNNLGILQRAIDLREFKHPFSQVVLREYERLGGDLPVLITVKSVEEALATKKVDMTLLEEIMKTRGGSSLAFS